MIFWSSIAFTFLFSGFEGTSVCNFEYKNYKICFFSRVIFWFTCENSCKIADYNIYFHPFSIFEFILWLYHYPLPQNSLIYSSQFKDHEPFHLVVAKCIYVLSTHIFWSITCSFEGMTLACIYSGLHLVLNRHLLWSSLGNTVSATIKIP